MKINIEQHISAALHKQAASITPVTGGSIASSYRVVMKNGNTLFVKTSPQHSEMFLKEANGLRELKKANAIRLPEIFFADHELLILEYLPSLPPQHREIFFERFGRAMAALHRQTAPRFGFFENNFIGSTPQINLPESDNWREFFFLHRMEYQIRLAEKNGYLDTNMRRTFAQLESMAERLIPSDGEPPALLHGDLWSGNFLCTGNDEPVIFDPAVYYGHREADLAMTMLFGGFDDSFYRSYHEEYPLNEGWRHRCEFYTLYHLLNHLNLFGEGYYPQVMSVAQKLIKWDF